MQATLSSLFLLYMMVGATSIISTSIGFGSIVLVPVFVAVFGPKDGVVLISAYFLCFNIIAVCVFRGHVDWKITSRLLIFAIPCAVVGSVFLTLTDPKTFSRALGAALLAYVLRRWFPGKPIRWPQSLVIALCACVYGFASGITGTGSIVKVPMFKALGLRKERYVATYAVSSLLVNVPKAIVFVGSGLLTRRVAIATLPLIALAVIGTLVGKRLLREIPEKAFARVIEWVVAVSAAGLILFGGVPGGAGTV